MTDPQSRLDRLRDANEQLVVGAMRAQDLADHAEARLAERLRFGALESEIATVCATASAEHIYDRIRDCLRRVVTFLGVDRGALAQPSSDLTVSVTHFWGLDGVVPPPVTIDLRAFLYFRSRMEAGQGWMTFERPDDLPPEAAAERAALETLGIRSFAAISLHAEDRWLGFLAFVSLGAARDLARKAHASVQAILAGEHDESVLEYPSSRRGEDRWLELRVRRLPRRRGGAAVMQLDVTARRQAEAAAQRHVAQLAHLDRIAGMGQLASSLAHELTQPLTAILANAQAGSRLLARLQPDLGELRACLEDIISDDRRATEVIRRTRRLLKKTDFVRLPVSLNDLVTNTIGLVANDALLHSVAIQFLPAPALPVTFGDHVQIQQVILNLLTNAIAAAAGGATRRVTVWTVVPTAPYIELAVHDSGEGIAADDVDRVFEPFFTTKADGLGMGLAISRTIVEAHGGRLLVENDPAGGATFRVHLRTD